MINTNRIDYKKDLEEVIFMFSSGENIDIVHLKKMMGVFLKTNLNF